MYWREINGNILTHNLLVHFLSTCNVCFGFGDAFKVFNLIFFQLTKNKSGVMAYELEKTLKSLIMFLWS